jgi:phosphoglycerate dehydrogenase-like enzyme
MNIILLQSKLKLEDIDKLLNEFPQFLFLSLTEEACHQLSHEQWSRVEILYGNHLSKEELSHAHQLKWLHLTSDDHRHISLDAIKAKGNILITDTLPPNTDQLAEFVVATIYSFAKNLPHWHEAAQFPGLIWDCKWKETMWNIHDCTLLQIGLNSLGTEIAKQCRHLGMNVWGVQEKRTFHPYCQKTVSINNLHSVLPRMDIVIISLPKGREYKNAFGKAEFELMKKDAVLVVVGNNKAVDEQALIATLNQGKLRGVLIDSYQGTPLATSSLLWRRPNVVITPDISSNPDNAATQSFQTFRYNMRQYLHGNINDMHNVVKANIQKTLKH